MSRMICKKCAKENFEGCEWDNTNNPSLSPSEYPCGRSLKPQYQLMEGELIVREETKGKESEDVKESEGSDSDSSDV